MGNVWLRDKFVGRFFLQQNGFGVTYESASDHRSFGTRLHASFAQEARTSKGLSLLVLAHVCSILFQIVNLLHDLRAVSRQNP